MQVLHQLPHKKDENLLVGIETADDAGVYRISKETAIISTVDFFPPIVDDPFTFGQIAAANALSDVYAMGGVPKLAMNIVCFPRGLDMSVLNEIIKGAMDKLNEAGALLVGGHSIEDDEIKYGLSVTGFVHPEKVLTNRGARAGDALVLTKPIGVGVITSALKKGRIKVSDAAPALSAMVTLNDKASLAAVETGVNACTDITGYGLLGHAMEMAKGSDTSIIIDSSAVRFFPGVKEFVKRSSNRPRSIKTNMEYLCRDMIFSTRVDKEREMLLFDPQTSGGLLLSVPREKANQLDRRLREAGIEPAFIGEVVEKEEDWRIKVI